MNDPPPLLRPSTRHTSGGQSPTRQRASDDVLQHITPATAVEALSSPAPALKQCLDEASPAEREFAMRTALASRSIWQWVDELGDWPWPSEGGSAGFEAPDHTRRKLFTSPGESKSTTTIGSLPAEDVAAYEARIEDIYGEMEGLAIEDIKGHVMTNHIMPLSRPTTPILGVGHAKMSNYNRMEDLTAVVTAIVVQTLPNLARLSRLLQIWSIRVGVLQKVPSLLRAIEDAESALRSGWAAITVPPEKLEGIDHQPAAPTLSRKDFGLMRLVIEKKVASPGRTLDYMLDRLEGLSDTLPDDWLDRMETVERGYSEWVAACERRIGEGERSRSSQVPKAATTPASSKQVPTENVAAEKRVEKRTSIDPNDNPATLLAPIQMEGYEEPSKQSRDTRAVSKSSSEDLANKDVQSTPPSSSPTEELPKLRITTEEASYNLDGTYEDEPLPRVQVPTTIAEESSPSPDHASAHSFADVDNDDIPEALRPTIECEEPELPTLPTQRRGSSASQGSVLLHDASHFDLTSDPPEISASPDISRTKIREAEYASPSPEASPPSSPPLPEDDARQSSVVTEQPGDASGVHDDSTAPKTPMEADQSFSEYFDDSFSVPDAVSPSVRRDSIGSVGNDHLQQQLSEIIDNIPAKIKLRREPPNLNPPDLQLPRLPRKSSTEPFKRSVSSMSNMSTRTATPSFTLSPAKNSRPRHQRSQQEIKVYHLSRSTGEAPIKLFIRCVGENGERVMVRVGGGWADLSEYLKEYASHHGRRSAGSEKAKVEIRDAPRDMRASEPPRSSPPSRPASALEASPTTPLTVRKTRRSVGASGSEAPRLKPRPTTPAIPASQRKVEEAADSPDDRFTRSRSSSHVSWVEDDSSFLGLAGPSSKKKEISEENKAWVESVKEKVRLASGERKISAPQDDYNRNKFGELGKVGGTKRIFRRADGLGPAQQGPKEVKK